MRSSRSEWMRRMFVRNETAVHSQLKTLEINDRTMLTDMAHRAKYLTE